MNTNKPCNHEWNFSRMVGHVCKKCYKIVQENPRRQQMAKEIKPTKRQLELIKCYWNRLQELESEFREKLGTLEAEMEKTTGIKGIEFFNCDGEYVGVGNITRTMKLIQL